MKTPSEAFAFALCGFVLSCIEKKIRVGGGQDNPEGLWCTGRAGQGGPGPGVLRDSGTRCPAEFVGSLGLLDDNPVAHMNI